jgi:hypothetical protein
MPRYLKLETSNMAIIILQKRLTASVVADSINKNRPGEKKGQMKEESASVFFTMRLAISVH